MTVFPERLGPDVEVSEVDLDEEPLLHLGKEYDEAGAHDLAHAVLSRLRGRPSLSGMREKSPSLTVRLPRAARARLDVVASEQGRPASAVVRDAIDEYLSRYVG